MELSSAVWSTIYCKPSLYRIASHTAVVYNGMIHIHGGRGDHPNNMLTINPENGESLLSPSFPSKRYTHSACLVNNHCYFFGGNDFSVRINEMWDYCFDDGSCQLIRPQKGTPSIRSCHSCVTYDYRMYIFGGYCPGSPIFNDLYEFNTLSSKWTQILPANDPQDKENLPARVYSHSACIIGDDMYIFGGATTEQIVQYDDRGIIGDLFKFHIPSRTWTKIPALGDHPCSRFMHTAVVHNGNMIIFGGQSLIKLNDLWEYNPQANRWRSLSTIGTIPAPRSGHVSVLVGNKMYIQGGTSIRNKKQADLHVLDLTNTVYSTAAVIERVLGRPKFQQILYPGEEFRNSPGAIATKYERRTYESQKIKLILESNAMHKITEYKEKQSKKKKISNIFSRSKTTNTPSTSVVTNTFQANSLPSFPNTSILENLSKPGRSNHRFPHQQIPGSPSYRGGGTPSAFQSPSAFHPETGPSPKIMLLKEIIVPAVCQSLDISRLSLNTLSMMADLDTADWFIQIDHHIWIVHSFIVQSRFPQLCQYCTSRQPLFVFQGLRDEYASLHQRKVSENGKQITDFKRRVRSIIKTREDRARSRCLSLSLSSDASQLLLGFMYSDQLLPLRFLPKMKSERHFVRVVKVFEMEQTEILEETLAIRHKEQNDEEEVPATTCYFELCALATKVGQDRLLSLSMNEILNQLSVDTVDVFLEKCAQYDLSFLERQLRSWKEQIAPG
ncbi:putative Tip elongation aberrant protein 1 [Blattamonas nauphoetae]|uniref:Tip elongation aberrant protein 1 n=1 Tax=Blattamonas nauphoetae TaxID=2049346 RepID=A0ABQ9XL53_9EUKA|nr:putative Tip elongation aberrant protein 1 [Blattamonas nauphoetae]